MKSLVQDKGVSGIHVSTGFIEKSQKSNPYLHFYLYCHIESIRLDLNFNGNLLYFTFLVLGGGGDGFLTAETGVE